MRKHNTVSWLVLIIALVVTSVIWITISNLDRQSDEIEFNSLSEKSTLQIQEKLKNHEQILRGFKGLFSASQIVEPDEFTNFYMVQEIDERFLDNQGVGYIEYIPNEIKKNELEYLIYPEGKRDKYFPVVFLEPLDFRNMRALGYDVYSEETRRQAIDHAIKTGDTTLTGKIILVQETDTDIQNGFLMILPVYKYWMIL
jgi:CHASE1-domain containing sensor protein